MSISYLRQIEKLQADVAHLEQASEAALELVDIVTVTRDTAWQELREIREGISANPEESTTDEVRRVVAERDALQAQVEALSKLHSDLTNADMVFEDDAHSGYLITTEQIDEMEHLLATPAACLTQVRAEAVNEFLHILEHAPSSPVSARTALGVSQWWVKLEAAKKQRGDA